MSVKLTIQLEDELFARAALLAEKRGISIDQLVSQQLERASAQDEYTRLQQKAALGQTARVAKPPQRAHKRRDLNLSPGTQMHKNAGT